MRFKFESVWLLRHMGFFNSICNEIVDVCVHIFVTTISHIANLYIRGGIIYMQTWIHVFEMNN